MILLICFHLIFANHSLVNCLTYRGFWMSQGRYIMDHLIFTYYRCKELKKKINQMNTIFFSILFYSFLILILIFFARAH